MSQAFIGEIRMFGFNFPPRSWAFCDGQLLPISQNTALFSLLGTTYGGDGISTFGLPDLRGRVPLHDGSGTGPGLSSYNLGQKGGLETVTLNQNQIPAHTHVPRCSSDDPNAGSPNNSFPAAVGSAIYATSANANMGATSSAGGSLSHENRQPFLLINFCICLQGLFPSRN